MLLLVLGHKGLLQSIGTRFLQQKLQLRAPYVTPLNILQVCLPNLSLFSSHVHLCRLFPVQPILVLQVYCLKSIRAIEAGEKIDPKYENYDPTDPEMKALLSRDHTRDQKQPYKSAVEDALIITMKGISAAMQNTG